MSKPEIALLMEKLGFTTHRMGDELHANCLVCRDAEGVYSFMVFPDGNAFCRRCDNWWNPWKFKNDFFGEQYTAEAIDRRQALIQLKPKEMVKIVPTTFPSLFLVTIR